MSTRTLQNYINGHFADHSGDFIPVLNPATGETIAQAPETTLDEVNRAVDAAEAAQADWAKVPASERASYLYKIADGIRKNAKDLARQITEEQGKILGLADGEVAFTLLGLEYTAEWARRIEGEILESDRPNENVFMFRMPIGVIAGILPWNFPFFLIVRKLAPSLVAGNTIVIKPSEETPINADDFMRIADDVGLPPGVVNFVHGRGATVGNALAGHPKVGMVSFTGSVDTGSKVMHAAADNITKVNLELGGKAPAIVLADADIELAASFIKQSRVINSGQVCNCVERVYVEKKVADEFTDKLAKVMATSKYGNPLEEEDLDYGPQINDKGIEKVETLVSSAVSAGATVVTGGKRSDRTPGNYYEPTVLADVKQDMDIIQREIFGPVAPIVTVDGLNEAISYANQSDYGLTSSIYTKDLNVAMRACKEIRFGETYINRENMEALNCFHAGVRKSGIGGADGKHGFYEYMQTHMVYIQYDA
jgi:lactaldehyde dehydrogenase/glycolaldehyde dehydrogenase